MTCHWRKVGALAVSRGAGAQLTFYRRHESVRCATRVNTTRLTGLDSFSGWIAGSLWSNVSCQVPSTTATPSCPRKACPTACSNEEAHKSVRMAIKEQFEQEARFPASASYGSSEHECLDSIFRQQSRAH